MKLPASHRTSPGWHSLAIVLCSVVSPFAAIALASEFSTEQVEFFEKRIRPLLATHCYGCHSGEAEKLKAGLLVDSREGLLVGGDSGPAIVPGDADASLLIEAIRYDAYEMPPKGKLPDADIEALTQWVSMGAPWPEELISTSTKTPARPVFNLAQRKADHWAWQPIARPAIPIVAEPNWPQNNIDNFILDRMEHEGVVPAPAVDRRGFIRRLYFDVIGLPPTVSQVDAFLKDDSNAAVDLVIEELLASPHFGERWGRHWLDLVRFAESRGHEFDADAPNAFQYRDYLIRAFNEDVPYDQLVREHLAGDLLPTPRINPEDYFNESILGTGFWHLGEWVHSPVDTRKDETDRFDNMIDVMSKTFLGVTVSCARCHDHKFDAISTRDYYALSGFLQSSDYRQVPYRSLEHNAQVARNLQALDEAYRDKILKALGKASAPETAKSNVVEGRTVVDFANIKSEDYIQEGFIFGAAPQLAGEWILKVQAGRPTLDRALITAACNDSFWDDLVNETEPDTTGARSLDHALRSGRTLHTASFDLETGNLACEVMGSGQIVACVDSHRQVAGPLHGETIVNFAPQGDGSSPQRTRWVSLNLQRYIGQRIHLEFTPAARQQLAVVRVVECAANASPPPLTSNAEPLDSVSVQEFVASVAAEELATQWFASREQLKQSVMNSSPLAIAMIDGSSEDDHVLIRGSSSNVGDVVERRFLEAIDGEQALEMQTRSGRLELAARINDPSNPLTARVIVNRIWHHLMGRGIVATTDDFGVLGQRPTHPELLDHLASWFVDNGRSIKQLIRYICLSNAYQMSSLPNPESVSIDPTNVCWHFRPPKRLEAEIIRDNLLAVSGDLDGSLFGRSVPIHLTGFMDGRGRPGQSGPLDGDRRRSIYIAVRRNFLSPFMLTFDTPSPFSSMGRRNVSNVPAQALIMMNDPFVAMQAEHWASRAVKTVPVDPRARIAWMYETAFARTATEAELDLALSFINHQAQDRSVTIDHLDVWVQLAHALMNTKEFVFLR